MLAFVRFVYGGVCVARRFARCAAGQRAGRGCVWRVAGGCVTESTTVIDGKEQSGWWD